MVAVAGDQQVLDGRGRVAVGLEPCRRAAVELRQQVGERSPGLQQEQVAEQVVVAVPLPRAVQPDHQLVAAGQVVQPAGAVGGAGDGVEQWPGQAVEHGGLHHPAAFLRLQHGQQFVGQVAGDQLVVTTERLDEAAGVRGALQRQPGQHQARGPPLRAVAQLAQAALVQPGGGGPEQAGRLGRVEPQVARPQLADTPADAHPPEAERWVGPGGQDDHQRVGAQLQQALHAPMDVRRLDEVVVVQHHHQPVRRGRQLVHQRGHHHVGVPLRPDHQRTHDIRHGRPHPADRRRHRRPEARRITVGLLQLQPGDVDLLGRHPARQERRLAGARRCADQDQRHPGSHRVVQHGGEARPVHQAWRPRRRAQLGGCHRAARPDHRAEPTRRSPG